MNLMPRIVKDRTLVALRAAVILGLGSLVISSVWAARSALETPTPGPRPEGAPRYSPGKQTHVHAFVDIREVEPEEVPEKNTPMPEESEPKVALASPTASTTRVDAATSMSCGVPSSTPSAASTTTPSASTMR